MSKLTVEKIAPKTEYHIRHKDDEKNLMTVLELSEEQAIELYQQLDKNLGIVRYREPIDCAYCPHRAYGPWYQPPYWFITNA